MADARFNRLAALEYSFFRLAHALWLASVEDADAANVPGTLAKIDQSSLDWRIRPDRRLFELLG